MGNISNQLTQAVITLGGKGTRLTSITNDIPKALWKIEGKHTFERTISILAEQGINFFILLLGYKSDIFKLESSILEKKYNVKIKTHIEKSPKGEAGSLLDVVKDLKDLFLFINGDIIFDIDLKRFFDFHIKNSADITFITHLTNHPKDSDCISESPSLKIYSYKLKNTEDNSNYFLGNAGISLIKKNIIKFIKEINHNNNQKLSLFRDFIIKSHQNNFLVFSYNTSEYLKDMGTPNRLEKVKEDIKKNLVQFNSYRVKQKVLFLDRDNTLIKSYKDDYIIDKNFYFFKERIQKIKKLASDFNFTVMVTNQPQIAMGLITYQKVLDLNAYVILECQKLGLNIALAYICPHHPHEGFKNEVSILKRNCFCRKPSPGLFFQASIERNISLKDSLLIGDSWRDQKSTDYTGMNFIYTYDLDSSS